MNNFMYRNKNKVKKKIRHESYDIFYEHINVFTFMTFTCKQFPLSDDSGSEKIK